jgi:hypothetical protein
MVRAKPIPRDISLEVSVEKLPESSDKNEIDKVVKKAKKKKRK